MGLALLVAACADDSADEASDDETSSEGASGTTSPSVDCPGEPLRLMTIAPLSEGGPDFQPEAAIGLEAAVAEANRTCEAGQPLEAVPCDDEFSPDAAAACARQAVDEGVVALVGNITAFGDNVLPVTEEAGIPSVGSVALAAADSTSPLSYPALNGISHIIGGYTMLGSLGATNVAIVYNDLPAVQFIIDLAEAQLESLDIEFEAIPVPPTETDLTQYAAQVIAADADAVSTILPGPMVVSLVRALQEQGADLHDLDVMTSETSVGTRVLAEAGDTANCLYGISVTWPVLDRSNPGIDQYLTELEAAGHSEEDAGQAGVIAWSMTHVVAELLAGASTRDSAGLVDAIEAADPIDRPEIAPIDWSTPAYSDDPALGDFRIFTDQLALSRVVDGHYVPVTSDFADEREIVEIEEVDC